MNGHVLKPYEFSGGNESNEYLINLGFEIKKCNDKSIDNNNIDSTILIGTCRIESNKTERRKVKEGMNYGFI